MMETPEFRKNLIEKRQALEHALQEYVRAARVEPGNMFVQDYVLAVASESMDEGYSNVTFFNHMNRPGMAIYQAVGLLHNCLGYYEGAGNPPRG
jgi:hypothetical protein